MNKQKMVDDLLNHTSPDNLVDWASTTLRKMTMKKLQETYEEMKDEIIEHKKMYGDE